MVRRKNARNKKKHPARKTYFVDFLLVDISEIFKHRGEIMSIAIPQTIRQNKRHKYAFIKFASQAAPHTTIRHENGRMLGLNRIRVHLAKKDMNINHPQPPFHGTNHHRQPSRPTPPRRDPPSLRDQRSYKEVVLIPQPMQTNHTHNQTPTKPAPKTNPNTQYRKSPLKSEKP